MTSEFLINLAIIASINLMVLVIVGRKIRISWQKGQFTLSWERNK